MVPVLHRGSAPGGARLAPDAAAGVSAPPGDGAGAVALHQHVARMDFRRVFSGRADAVDHVDNREKEASGKREVFGSPLRPQAT